MDVRIEDFPETRVAAIELRGPAAAQEAGARRLIEWRIANGASPDRHRTYGIHHDDPRTTAPEEQRVDLCVSVEQDIPANPQGLVNKHIPAGRCAVVRHLGTRANVSAAAYLFDIWLPASGETLRDFPLFFHYVIVGPNVREDEMITDVYLPLHGFRVDRWGTRIGEADTLPTHLPITRRHWSVHLNARPGPWRAAGSKP